MALTIGAGDQEFALQGDIIYRLIQFAAKWQVHILVWVRPNKADAEIKGLGNIYGASKMGNWAHKVLAIHKFSPEEKVKHKKEHPDQEIGDARIKILKSKVAPSDEAVYLDFDGAGRRFCKPSEHRCFPWKAAQNDDLPFPVDDSSGEQASIFEEPDHAQPA